MTDVLIGRDAERTAIEALLAGAENGSSGVLVLSGAAGMGKSSLLQYALDTATAFRVLAVTGVESEMAFGYAGVHQLVMPLLDRAGALPAPQRLALDAVFGNVHHDRFDPYLVGLAILNLLADAGRETPVLVVVDDAQWLDQESMTALSFVARRLDAERVAMLVAIRRLTGGRDGFEGIRGLEVGGLPAPEARQLLVSVAAESIDDAVAGRLVAAADGNALALVELPAALTAEQLRGVAALPDPLPIGAGLSRLFTMRAGSLDPEAQLVLLLAAAERMGDPGLLGRAGMAAGVSWDEAATRAEASGLVTFAPTVRFRHPLVRSAVYYSAEPGQRRRAHAALAEALDTEDDADRRAWHLGAASVVPDESVAAALEASAERARRRGGSSVAAEYLLRAAELTPDPARATARLLNAARGELVAGRADRAEEMVERARASGVGTGHEADAAWTQGLVHLVNGNVRDAATLLAEALGLITPRDAVVALGTCVAAAAMALDGGHLTDRSTRLATASGLPRVVDLYEILGPMAELVRAIASQLVDGRTEALVKVRDAVAGAAADPGRFQAAAGRHVHVAYFDTIMVAIDLLDDTAFDALTQAWSQLARRTGALAPLPLALSFRSWLDVLQGRPGTAASHLAEIDELVSLTRSRGLLGTPAPARVLLDAWQGNDEATRAGARRMMQDGHERGQGTAIDRAYAALVVLEIGNGRYAAALRAAGRVHDHDDVAVGALALTDLVEAAARCGEPTLAAEGLERLSSRASASGSPWARGLLARARALTAGDEVADDHFRTALDELSRCSIATDLARTQLLYGEWLRRARRRREAREPLHAALQFFEAMGAEGFASRTRAELAATGEHVPSRSRPVDLLTPQEAQIARLAAAGERNHDIAGQLYITTSTVEYHLRKVFVKLGVTSRTQLAQIDLPT